MLIERFRPSTCIVAWDSPRSIRREQFPEYKSDRDEKPEEIIESLAVTKATCLSMGLSVVEQDGYESDDVIATCCTLARELGSRSIIYSIDKDMRQLLQKGWVTQLCKVTSVDADLECQWMTADKLEAKTGLRPFQWIDFQTLVGGKNGVPGIPGIGEKRATALLKEHKSLDQFFSDPAMNTGSYGHVFRERDMVERYRSLHTLKRDLELRSDIIEQQINEYWKRVNSA